MKKFYGLLCFVIIAFVALSPIHAEKLIIPVDQDTFLNNQKPDLNRGDRPTFWARGGGPDAPENPFRIEAMVGINIKDFIALCESLPYYDRVVVNSFKFYAYNSSIYEKTGIVYIALGQDDSWDENAVTWNTSNGNYSSALDGVEFYLPPGDESSFLGWTSWDVTGIYPEDTLDEYLTFYLYSREPQATNAGFDSSESYNPPYLEIDYDIFSDLFPTTLKEIYDPSLPLGDGPYNITLDPETDMEWLDIGASPALNLPVLGTTNELEEAIGPGGKYEGFKLATEEELETFFNHAGLQIGTNVPTDCYALGRFLQLTGYTYSDSTYGPDGAEDFFATLGGYSSDISPKAWSHNTLQLTWPYLVNPEICYGYLELITGYYPADFPVFSWLNRPSYTDNCPGDPNKTEPGICGCGIADTDIDTDGIPDCNDNCPNDINKTQPGICGCGEADSDTDGDGIPDCIDSCNNLIDTDGDGINDCADLCPKDLNKSKPGICGCGIADVDTDLDGIFDCNDDCPNDVNKTQPGTCGCGVPDTDSDLDGTTDCVDLCPNDINKSQPGICGCGIPDIDSDDDGIMDCKDGCNNLIDFDGDGINDCDDLCPEDPSKFQPGTCGCGIDDSDSDNDGVANCLDSNDDGDGLSDGEEQGPDLNYPEYDGNGDDIADHLQGNVASFHTYNGQNYISIVSPSGTTIRNCKAVNKPSDSNSPQNIDFPYGFFGFSIEGLASDDAATATMYLPAGYTFNTYYRYGPTPDNPTDHWYEFLYDGQTGAEINGNVITLHFADGLRGDDDLASNGVISDVGAPGIILDSGDSGDSGVQVVSSSGGGGGGCFISSAIK